MVSNNCVISIWIVFLANETVYDEPDQVEAVPEHDPAEDPEVVPEEYYEGEEGDDHDEHDLAELSDEELAEAAAELTLGDMLDSFDDGD